MKWVVFAFMMLSHPVFAQCDSTKELDFLAILDEAIEARKKGKLSDALEKHVLIHKESLKYPAYAGIRLSYNIEEWLALSEIYPEAKKLLLKELKETEISIVSGEENYYQTFLDFKAINSYLGLSQNTVDLYGWLSKNRPEIAKKLVHVAYSDLLEAKEYELLNKYVDPFKRLDGILETHKMNLESLSSPEFGEDFKEYTEQYFTYNVSSLVVMLVKTNQAELARKIADMTKNKLVSNNYNTEIKNALNGIPPKKWP